MSANTLSVSPVKSPPTRAISRGNIISNLSAYKARSRAEIHPLQPTMTEETDSLLEVLSSESGISKLEKEE